MFTNRCHIQESTDINESLWALKECIRVKALNEEEDGSEKKRLVIPYRNSNLTRLLQESFDRKDAKLCVVATVTPNATDTEHTMESLKTVCTIAGTNKNITEGNVRTCFPSSLKHGKSKLVAPKCWTNDQLARWLENKRIPFTKIPDDVDGKVVMHMSAIQLRARLCDGNIQIADKIFKALRNESDRVDRILREERKKARR